MVLDSSKYLHLEELFLQKIGKFFCFNNSIIDVGLTV
jgi:hypothetical protein